MKIEKQRWFLYMHLIARCKSYFFVFTNVPLILFANVFTFINRKTKRILLFNYSYFVMMWIKTPRSVQVLSLSVDLCVKCGIRIWEMFLIYPKFVAWVTVSIFMLWMQVLMTWLQISWNFHNFVFPLHHVFVFFIEGRELGDDFFFLVKLFV